MKRFYKPTIALSAMVLFTTGCGPKKIADETAPGCYPQNLRVAVNDASMDISWVNPCDRIIGGYNIYISDEPLVEKYPDTTLPATVEPFNHAVYAGDTNPDDEREHFVAERLENGKRFYVSVRIVNPNKSLSKPSAEAQVVCGPRGEIDLPIRYNSDKDGYSFEQNDYVSATATNNDLYFFSKDGVDYIASPSRLDGFLKQNRIARLSIKGDFETVAARFSSLKSQPEEDKLAVKKGDWLHFVTPQKTHALVKVVDLSGQGEGRVVRLFFAYSGLPGQPIF